MNSSIQEIEKMKEYTLIIAGEKLDSHNSTDFINKTINLSGNVIIDMSNLQILTSAGIGALFMLIKHTSVCIVGAKEHLRKMELVGLAKRFTFCNNVEEAKCKIMGEISNS